MEAISAENAIIAVRVIDMPRDKIYGAWADPELLARWWGPKGFTNTFHEFSFKEGGQWTYTMHGPDGTDYQNHNVFEQIVPLERIAIRHLSGHEFLLTAVFEDAGGGTRLTFCQQFMDAEEYERVKPYCIEGNEQNLDRLGALLHEL